MSVQRLSHIGICVSDLERSTHFYTQALGFKELSRLQVEGDDSARLLDIEGGHLQAVYLEREGTRLELLYYPEAGSQAATTPSAMNRVGFTHLSLRVDELESVLQAIGESGGDSLAHTHVENPEWGTKAIFALDPDGLRIELLQAPGDPDRLPGS